jgi:hypothetical protein
MKELESQASAACSVLFGWFVQASNVGKLVTRESVSVSDIGNRGKGKLHYITLR